jgi:hypothetical protein
MKAESICLLFLLLACATGAQSTEPSATRRRTAYSGPIIDVHLHTDLPASVGQRLN